MKSYKILKNYMKSFEEVLEFSRRDRWYNSDEALAFGLVDEVIGADKNKSITQILFSNITDHFLTQKIEKKIKN